MILVTITVLSISVCVRVIDVFLHRSVEGRVRNDGEPDCRDRLNTSMEPRTQLICKQGINA
jgi:hypothetical protein